MKELNTYAVIVEVTALVTASVTAFDECEAEALAAELVHDTLAVDKDCWIARCKAQGRDACIHKMELEG